MENRYFVRQHGEAWDVIDTKEKDSRGFSLTVVSQETFGIAMKCRESLEMGFDAYHWMDNPKVTTQVGDNVIYLELNKDLSHTIRLKATEKNSARETTYDIVVIRDGKITLNVWALGLFGIELI